MMKLKPCPSCGSDQIAKWGDNRVVCVPCGCSMIISQWNTRHCPQEMAEYNHPDITKTKLIVAIDALEEIAKKATFTEIRRMSSEALEKIK